ncbi:alpha/beta fold hydrolase [Bacillus sp. H-16]|uniref:esterase/lipase family protein n=1 Tax=Alteribacter salitolerans TaxID=2912333 RepID=UPI001966C878|nr:alpha/beta fold hydrolase [Alteribacter salitolerans]MBM7094434.1 alpha/beta fold hydrolase [Alteribacter salitolerans]
MKKKILLILVVTLLMSTHVAGASGFHETIGTPGEPGTVMIGEMPDNPDPDKPVLLFVQGLTNNSGAWYEGNAMYSTARDAGYETAFVELYDSGGEPRSYWNNGAMLANQIEQISHYFNGKDIVVLGYSKGGVDAQAALIHYGKHHLVRDVITIGSPHYGSELADLAHSTWAGWLAALIGARSEGTESLQTGNMSYFRSITDNRWEALENTYFTIAGDRAGPLFSSYFTGGLFIPGPSDGVVSVESAHLPYGNMLAIGNWNHGEVHLGQYAFPVFSPVLTAPQPVQQNGYEEKTVESDFDILVRGGEKHGEMEETFPVEEGVNKITADWISSEELTEIEVTDPDGNTDKIQVTAKEGEVYFDGAWHHTLEINKPEPGEWTVKTAGGNSAYLLVAAFDSPLNSKVEVTMPAGKKGWKVAPASTGISPQAGQAVSVHASTEFMPGLRGQSPQSVPRSKTIKQRGQKGVINLPFKGEGSYNTTLDIKGTTPSGHSFERTVIRSVFVDDLGIVHD